MQKITESLLIELEWIDFSIIIDSDKNCLLILICKEENGKNGFYNLLTNYDFKLLTFIEDDKTYTISIEFDIANRSLSYSTNLTSEQYPPLIWLNNGTVKYITTGLWLAEGTMSDYYKPLIPLYGRIHNN